MAPIPKRLVPTSPVAPHKLLVLLAVGLLPYFPCTTALPGAVLRLGSRIAARSDQQQVVQQSHPVVCRPGYAVVQAVVSADMQVGAQDGRRVGVDQPPTVRGVPQKRLLEEPVVVVEGREHVARGSGVDEGESHVEIDRPFEHPKEREWYVAVRCGAIDDCGETYVEGGGMEQRLWQARSCGTEHFPIAIQYSAASC